MSLVNSKSTVAESVPTCVTALRHSLQACGSHHIMGTSTGWDPWHTVPNNWLVVAKKRSSLTDRFHATQSAVCRCSDVRTSP